MKIYLMRNFALTFATLSLLLFLPFGAYAQKNNPGANGAANGKPFQVLQGQIDALDAELEVIETVLSGSCPAGSALRDLNDNGSVVCETIGFGDTTKRAFVLEVVTLNAGQTEAFVVACPSGFEAVSAGYSYSSVDRWIVGTARSIGFGSLLRFISIGPADGAQYQALVRADCLNVSI